MLPLALMASNTSFHTNYLYISDGVAGIGIDNIPKFGGDIYYVSKAGNDSNSGSSPDVSKLTIQNGLDACSAGDAVNVMAGTYVENLTMSTASVKLWFEAGTVLDGDGTCLTVSGGSCYIKGFAKITPAANQIGVSVITNTGNIFEDVMIEGAASTGGFDIDTNNNQFFRCRVRGIKAGGKAFDLNGNGMKLYDCSTTGTTTSYGYYVNGTTLSKGTLRNCTSAGHQTSGFYIDEISEMTLIGCSSGAGDGKWRDIDNANVWCDFCYDDILHATSTLTAAGGVGGTGTVYNLFKITGAVRIFNIYGHVSTEIQDPGATQINLELGGTAQINITAAGGDIGGAPIGTTFIRNSVSGDAMSVTFPTATPVFIENANYRDPNNPITLVAENGTDTYIELHLSDNPTSGAIHWHIEWEEVTDDGMIIAQ